MKKILFICFFLFSPFLVHGAELSITLDLGNKVQTSKPFVAEILMKTEESINAISGKVIVPKGLQATDVRFDNSIISLWVEAPHIVTLKDHQEIVFSGLIPGGFSGLLSPYYRGVRAASLFNIRMYSTEPGDFVLSMQEGRVYSNDGSGTEKNIPDVQAVVTAGGSAGTIGEKKIDTTAPEEFLPVISHSSLLYGDKWFASFDTKDAESGIGYFEVAEVKPNSFAEPLWKKAESPYLLLDQSLESTVFVRAVDKEGNVRMEEVHPREKNKKTHFPLISGIIFLAVLLWAFLKRSHEK
ncbi:MAG: hypothetical protein V4465_02865 [Patescibacteria group bacterium]